MRNDGEEKLRFLIEILVIVFVFIIVTFFVQTHIDYFENLIEFSFLGILIYIFILVFAIVFAPFSSMPFLPIVSNAWGWKLAGAVSVIGWTLGSIVVFIITRTYGVTLVKKMLPLTKIYSLEKKFPKKNLFFVVLFLRMIVPVDILSYALGLFSSIRFWPYVIATFLGIIPFAFIFAYLGSVPFILQLLVILIIGIILLSGYIVKEIKK